MKMKKKRIVVAMLSSFMLLTIATIPVSAISLNKENDKNLMEMSIISADIKVKTPGGSWQDVSVTADTGTNLEFKLDMIVPGGGLIVAILIPYINEEPMLSYVVGSGSDIPFFVDEAVIMWGYAASPPNSLTFKLRLLKAGTGSVDSSVCDVSSQETGEDTVQVIGQGGCCFPAGTLVTMFDGSKKCIEEVKIGDKVLSYDAESQEYSSWFVKMLGRPTHPVCNINDGQLRLTVDHPIFVKKADGRKGIGAIDKLKSKESITFEDEVLSVELGDYIFTKDKGFVRVESITFEEEYIQTYNILSFSGTRNFFANGVLVYEEHPKTAFTSPFLEQIMERFPRISQIILSSPLFKSIFTPN